MAARQDSSSPTDLALLAHQAEIGLDGRGRLVGVCGVGIAVSRDGQMLFVGDQIQDMLVPALADAFDQSPHVAPDREPSALVACRAILEPTCAPLSLEAGPSYLIEPDVRFEAQTEIIRSDAPESRWLRQGNPGNWEPDEWDDLLDGTLGPWTMAVVDSRVVSICHTPARMTDQAAECGVWTHPHFRGHGYAAAVTAAWADILRPSGRSLFYSTDAENHSSKRVAARLQLRPIGWTWRLIRADPGQRPLRHPLSRPSS